MDVVWPLIVVLAVGLALSIVFAAGPWLIRGTSLRARAFWCPFRERNVRVMFDASNWDERRTDVRACSAFSPMTAVTCRKSCLNLLRLPPPR